MSNATKTLDMEHGRLVWEEKLTGMPNPTTYGALSIVMSTLRGIADINEQAVRIFDSIGDQSLDQHKGVWAIEAPGEIRIAFEFNRDTGETRLIIKALNPEITEYLERWHDSTWDLESIVKKIYWWAKNWFQEYIIMRRLDEETRREREKQKFLEDNREDIEGMLADLDMETGERRPARLTGTTDDVKMIRKKNGGEE